MTHHHVDVDDTSDAATRHAAHPADELEQRWAALGGSASDAWQRAGADLLARYDEPWRGYHNRLHITESLDALATLGGGLAEQVAIWFHDAVYGLGPGDDERASADLAASVLGGLGMASSLIRQVVRLVLLTEHHSPAPGDLPGGMVSDADMAILAAEPVRYDASVAGIRREYAQFTDDEFRTGRIQVLESFLSRDHIFHTPHGQSQWEHRARANITRELGSLRTHDHPWR